MFAGGRFAPHLAQNCAPTEYGIPHFEQKPAAIGAADMILELSPIV